jgi:hypothetical protein
MLRRIIRLLIVIIRNRPVEPVDRSTGLKTDRRTWGIDVMITIFDDFKQFSAKNLAFFSKTNNMIKCLHNLALFRVKNANFLPIFLGKY